MLEVNDNHPPVSPSVIGGLHEVSELLDRSENLVCSWVRRPPRRGFVAPIRALAATKIWDLEEVREWGRKNPRHVGPGFCG